MYYGHANYTKKYVFVYKQAWMVKFQKSLTGQTLQSSLDLEYGRILLTKHVITPAPGR